MRARLVLLSVAAAFAAILHLGCATPISARAKAGVDRVAVIVLVDTPPVARVEGLPADPGEGDLAAMVAERIGSVVSGYAVEQSVRRSFIDSMARPAPFRVAPPIEVAGVMGGLLAREEEPQYGRLQQIDVDAVLEVRVVEWGMGIRGEEAGGFIRMDARMIRLGKRDRIVWKGRASVDRLLEGGAPGVDGSLFMQEQEVIEATMIDMASVAGERLAQRAGLR